MRRAPAILTFYALEASRFLAKIAVASRILGLPAGETKTPRARVLASGNGWTVSDVVCSAGPRDLPFEEQHTGTSIAIVVSGTFQYRTSTGGELMTPGSLLLGNAGDGFTCGHEHGSGDRCLSFSYGPEFREELAAGMSSAKSGFNLPRLPPIRELSPLIANAVALLNKTDSGSISAKLPFNFLAERCRPWADSAMVRCSSRGEYACPRNKSRALDRIQAGGCP